MGVIADRLGLSGVVFGSVLKRLSSEGISLCSTLKELASHALVFWVSMSFTAWVVNFSSCIRRVKVSFLFPMMQWAMFFAKIGFRLTITSRTFAIAQP